AGGGARAERPRRDRDGHGAVHGGHVLRWGVPAAVHAPRSDRHDRRLRASGRADAARQLERNGALGPSPGHDGGDRPGLRDALGPGLQVGVMGMATAVERPESGSKVERTYGPLLDWVPYVTLAVGWALSLAVSDQPVEHRLVTTGVAAAAVAWTYLGYTRLPSRESSPVRFAVYFFGMVALGAALMHRDGLFFVFVITGFFHANLLRPPPLVFLGIAATSAVVNQGILEDAEMLE